MLPTRTSPSRTTAATSPPTITSTTSTTVVIQTSATTPASTNADFATGTSPDVVVTIRPTSNSLMTLSNDEYATALSKISTTVQSV